MGKVKYAVHFLLGLSLGAALAVTQLHAADKCGNRAEVRDRHRSFKHGHGMDSFSAR